MKHHTKFGKGHFTGKFGEPDTRDDFISAKTPDGKHKTSVTFGPDGNIRDRHRKGDGFGNGMKKLFGDD